MHFFTLGNLQEFIRALKNLNECLGVQHSAGAKAVFKFCLNNKIKLVYSATSASLGNEWKR